MKLLQIASPKLLKFVIKATNLRILNKQTLVELLQLLH